MTGRSLLFANISRTIFLDGEDLNTDDECAIDDLAARKP
jgi:hypothetical protein